MRGVVPKMRASDAREGNDAVVAALAVVDAQEFVFEVHVGDGEVEEFALADAGGVEDFEDCAVAVAEEGARVGSLDDGDGLGGAEDFAGEAVGLAENE